MNTVVAFLFRSLSTGETMRELIKLTIHFINLVFWIYLIVYLCDV